MLEQEIIRSQQEHRGTEAEMSGHVSDKCTSLGCRVRTKYKPALSAAVQTPPPLKSIPISQSVCRARAHQMPFAGTPPTLVLVCPCFCRSVIWCQRKHTVQARPTHPCPLTLFCCRGWQHIYWRTGGRDRGVGWAGWTGITGRPGWDPVR